MTTADRGNVLVFARELGEFFQVSPSKVSLWTLHAADGICLSGVILSWSTTMQTVL
jgi:hypothetical protein